MVIYKKTSRFAFHLLHEEKSKVRISEDAYKHNGELQPLPMQRAFLALKEFLEISASFKSRKILCVATSALRDAPNKQEFIQKVHHKLQLNIKIISGEKEAYFGAMACANLLPQQENGMSIDIGGGSTEIAFVHHDDVTHTQSLKLGTVRLKELYFDRGDIQGAIEYVDTQLQTLPENTISTLIGIGGTFRAVSLAILKQKNYPLEKLHAFRYDTQTFHNYLSAVMQASNTQELQELFIKSARFDVIQPGVLILLRVLHKYQNVTQIVTSGVGVREGVYLSDLLRNSHHKFPHNYNTSVRFLLDTHLDNNKEFSNNLNKLAKELFDILAPYFGVKPHYKKELAIAAKLYPCGSDIHFYSQNKHTYYLIQSALEYGFTHESIMLIATLTKYAKKKLPSSSHMKKYAQLLPETQTTHYLSYILSLAIALLSHRPRNKDFTLSLEKNTLIVISKNPLYLAQKNALELSCHHKDFKLVFQV
jgi:exopolyphosphatase/guanosine-5'-triphosphate,3'-diphosphate pyrophosphatase